MNLAEVFKENFEMLNNLFNGELFLFAAEVSTLCIFKSPGYIDLVAEIIDRDIFNHPIMSLAHYCENNGDLVSDPEVTFTILEDGVIFVLTYQDQFVYKESFPKTKPYDTTVMEDINIFLHTWLQNIERQNYKLINKGEESND